MSDLLPCPFCGGEAEYHSDNGPTGEVYGWVGCNQCDAMSCHIDTRSMQPEETHPIAAWNTRVASHPATSTPVVSHKQPETSDKLAATSAISEPRSENARLNDAKWGKV